jgi:DNA-directed RNA polymerase subunit beta'
MKQMTEDKQGFNSVYMMLDSGARGSKEQIRQLSGMRGLMAKPQKSGATTQEIIENPILSNFKEGLSILEYFISTHGARKGLADTALKTADAGYLTRRLVDVAQDVVITEDDCGTLRGLTVTALKDNEEIIESLYDRILGRVSVLDVINPANDEIIVAAGDEITEVEAKAIEDAGIQEVDVRSVLTCATVRGVCEKCYGRDLSTGRMVKRGLAVGVIAAQSIGEPGTQLTLRTFHVGGTASNIAAENRIESKTDSRLEFDDLKTVRSSDDDHDIVVSRSGELRIFDQKTGNLAGTYNVPYGSKLHVKGNGKVKAGFIICEWDPYNAVIVSETDGKIGFENIEEGFSFKVESDEQTGFVEKVIIDSRDKKRIPTVNILKGKEVIKSYNMPVGAHIIINEGDAIKAGEILVKIPRASGKTGDITGGLPRVTELFEARNPSNPAVVSEVDGMVSFGKIKRGNREVVIETRTGEIRKYLVPLSKHILVQENDFVKAGSALSEGATTPSDILAIMGPTAVQEYIVNEIQEVYRLQGVKINDKHYEVIVRQMMRKVTIADPGDTKFLEKEIANRYEFKEENDWIYGKMYVEDPGDSENVKAGQIITARKLRDENSMLKRKDLKPVDARDAVPATSSPILQGITRASLQTDSFISAASFQETTKVLNEAAVKGKVDNLMGLKENVIVGHLIPAGTGQRQFDKMIVGSKEEYEQLLASKEEEDYQTAE